MRIPLCILCFALCTPIFADDAAYIGTQSKPIPLQSAGPQRELESVTIYLYKDLSYEIKEENNILFSGQYTINDHSVSFNDRVAFANKIFQSKNGVSMTCLQTVFYKPQKYAYRCDWFCPKID